MISVIISIFNTESYLERCLQSIVNQFDESNGEIILIDDGSTDKSSEICNKYVNNFKFIRYFYQKNTGLSSARNLGIQKSHYEYLFFIDSDDYIESDIIKTINSYLDNNSFDILIFGISKLYTDNNSNIQSIRKLAIPNNRYSFTNPILALKFAIETYGFDCYACNKIIKKSLFIKNNIEFPIGKLYEDMYTIPKIILNAQNILFLNSYGYCYIIRNNSISNSKMNIKQFHNILSRIALLKYVDSYYYNKLLLVSIHKLVLNGFISTGYKMLNSKNNVLYFQKKMKRLLISYSKKYYIIMLKSLFSIQFVALLSYLITPNIFKYIYKIKYKNNNN